jgi:hypothetical protein
MVMEHPVDCQIFYRDKPKMIDYLSAVLMREVLAFEANPFVGSGYSLAPNPTLRRAFSLFGKLALHFGKSFFFLAKEARIFNLSTIREGGEGVQPDINSNLFRVFWQYFRFAVLTTETDVPFAGGRTGYRTGFDTTLYRSMQHNANVSYFGQNEFTAFELTARRGLWESDAIVSAISLETWVSGIFSCLNPAKEGLESKVKPDSHILKDLGVDLVKTIAFKFQSWQFGLLLVERRGFLGFFVGVAFLLKPVIIQPATLFQLLFKQTGLFLGWINSVLKRFSHKNIISDFTLNHKIYLNISVFLVADHSR